MFKSRNDLIQLIHCDGELRHQNHSICIYRTFYAMKLTYDALF